MSDLKRGLWHNAKAEIKFTVGLLKSVSIISINEVYVNGAMCDCVYQDVVEEGAQTILEHIGVDTAKKGEFIAQVLVKCNYDESPDYKLVTVASCDSNQELIAKQQEQIELLRDALVKLSNGEMTKSAEFLLISTVLAATAKG